MLPSVYKNLGYGEKKILGIFISKEIEDKNEEIKAMQE
jgi:hypothetical protein